MKSEEDSTKYSPIPSSRPSKDVLENFVGELKIPIGTIEDLLPTLFEITKQEDGKEIFPQLAQALLITNRNIVLVHEYLHPRTRDNIADTTNVAAQILNQFTHELREASAPLTGYVAVCEQFVLSEDELTHFLKNIKTFGKPLPKIFKVLEENWQIWLERGNFDWNRDDWHLWGPD